MAEPSTREPAARPRSVRIGPAWDRAEELAGKLGLTTTDYVREAIERHNQHCALLLARDVQTLPAGDVHWDGATLTAGGEALRPGLYRIAGTTSVVEVTASIGEFTEADYDPLA